MSGKKESTEFST